MRSAISSAVLTTFIPILQPVRSWKGVTQSTRGSVPPLSTQPGSVRRFSVPSPGPRVLTTLATPTGLSSPPLHAPSKAAPSAAAAARAVVVLTRAVALRRMSLPIRARALPLTNGPVGAA
ncbi:hypothetical protein GCM10023178_76720 [Actinomadura luteofluorescens]